MKACPEYETKVRDPVPAPPANHLWCLPCGCSEHATAKCSTTDPQVNFPPDDGISCGCLFCGVFGHNRQSCLHRVPQVQGEQASKLTALATDEESQQAAILQLQTNVKALQSSHKIIQECKSDLVLLNNKVSTLMSFRENTESRLTTAERANTKFQQFLEKTWQPHSAHFRNSSTKNGHQSNSDSNKCFRAI